MTRTVPVVLSPRPSAEALIDESGVLGHPREWTVEEARWIKDEEGVILESHPNHYEPMLRSQPMTLRGGRVYIFKVSLAIVGEGGVHLGVVHVRRRRWARQRVFGGAGSHEATLRVPVKKTAAYRFVVANFRPREMAVTRVRQLAVSVASKRLAVVEGAVAETALPHWRGWQRAIHAACKRSRVVNAAVAAAEMRLGRDEVLSLPQYMALCPTGQCNALCGFCSVTQNRTGIIKRQLPFAALERFLTPVSRTVWMYGLEGNGEPTLYEHFDELVESLTLDGATFYLITNGERLRPDQVELLLALGIDAVNFSLNAATAATHARVMKLKHFDAVVANIRRFVEGRGRSKTPMVSVSFVVDRDNIGEVQEFLRFAEQELKVDRVLVRPLSEIATDQGAVEDFRGLVPHESDIKDMLDGVRDYLQDTPRRSEIQIAPETFRAWQSDPVDRVLMPEGFEDRLLAPRRADWVAETPLLRVSWSVNRARLACPAEAAAGTLWRSAEIPVTPRTRLVYRARIDARQPLRVSVLDGEGQELASAVMGGAEGARDVCLAFDTGANEWLRLAFGHLGGPLDAEVDFGRLRTPPRRLHREFKLPHRRRWEVGVPGAAVDWKDNEVRVRWAGEPGPYLLKSYSVPCPAGATFALEVTVEVRQGTLGLGVLSADFQRWTHTFTFGVGRHEPTLAITSGDNERLQVVLYSAGSEPLNASVDWRNSLERPPAHEEAGPSVAAAAAGRANRLPPRDAVRRVARAAAGVASGAARKWRRLTRGRVRFYCQKPWTDLSNFSVDGRMDVCCIATGASQERYALGNMLQQTFQDVWNGERAREFRRTVNSDQPLPPCQRCPMLFQYQGLFFDPRHTLQGLDMFLRRATARWPGGDLLRRAVYWPASSVVSLLLFRGFKRP